jgi:hypothetical protein
MQPNQQVTIEDVKVAIEDLKGPEADGAAGYERLSKKAKELFQALDGAEQQNLLNNLSENDRKVLTGGRRRRGKTSKKSKRRRNTRRHR